MRETVLDWKPFDYFTVEQNSGPMGVMQMTFALEPVDAQSTRLHCRIRGRLPGLPAFLQRPSSVLAHAVIKFARCCSS